MSPCSPVSWSPGLPRAPSPRRPRALCLLLALLLLLPLAGCGEIPTVPPLQESTSAAAPPPALSSPPVATVESYPPPPTPEALPPPTSAPTVPLTPTLLVQPVLEELRSGERIAFLRDGNLWLVRPDGSTQVQVTTSENVTALYGWSHDCRRLLLGVGKRPVPPETDMPGGKDLTIK